MKKSLLILLFFLSISACTKDKMLPQDEIPNWLKERILEDEELIKSNPQSGRDIACWMRYEYSDNYYFEYLNLLMSSFPPVYDYEGNEFIFYTDPDSDYSKKKCCKIYVWKGASYFELDK